MERIEFKNMKIEESRDVLEKMSNCAPLLNRRAFEGHFQEGDLISFENATLVKEHTETCDYFVVKAILGRKGSRRGVFIPISFFAHCFYYSGDGADYMTTFQNLYEMLATLSAEKVVFEVKRVYEKIVTKNEKTRKIYDYHLDFYKG